MQHAAWNNATKQRKKLLFENKKRLIKNGGSNGSNWCCLQFSGMLAVPEQQASRKTDATEHEEKDEKDEKEENEEKESEKKFSGKKNE